MPARDRQNFKLGLFVFFTLSLFVALVLSLGRCPSFMHTAVSTVVLDIVMGSVYFVSSAVGVLPSRV